MLIGSNSSAMQSFPIPLSRKLECFCHNQQCLRIAEVLNSAEKEAISAWAGTPLSKNSEITREFREPIYKRKLIEAKEENQFTSDDFELYKDYVGATLIPHLALTQKEWEKEEGILAFNLFKTAGTLLSLAGVFYIMPHVMPQFFDYAQCRLLSIFTAISSIGIPVYNHFSFEWIRKKRIEKLREDALRIDNQRNVIANLEFKQSDS